MSEEAPFQRVREVLPPVAPRVDPLARVVGDAVARRPGGVDEVEGVLAEVGLGEGSEVVDAVLRRRHAVAHRHEQARLPQVLDERRGVVAGPVEALGVRVAVDVDVLLALGVEAGRPFRSLDRENA